MAEQTGNVKSGEAGHSGRDRQPMKAHGKSDASSSPEAVKSRSDEAGENMKNENQNRPDMVHPGPNREEAEISKGDAHKDQRETEKEMKPEGL